MGNESNPVARLAAFSCKKIVNACQFDEQVTSINSK